MFTHNQTQVNVYTQSNTS